MRLAVTAVGLCLLAGAAGAAFWWAFEQSHEEFGRTGRAVPAYDRSR